MHAIVAGGGLAGLVAARHLAEAGAEVELLERRDRVGGRVRTRSVDGFTLDRGFQVHFTAYPAGKRELDYDALDLRSFAPGATIAWPDHRSTLSDPLGDPRAALPTLLNRDVRTADKLRLLKLQRALGRRDAPDIFPERGVSGGHSEPTIREYLAEQGFSTAFVERFAEPFYGGITLDRALETSSSVFEYTFKMLSEGKTVVPAEGMGAIPKQLRGRAVAAGVTVETGVTVTDVRPAGDGVEVETEGEDRAADAVVVATDPNAATELTGVETPTEPKACTTVHCSLPAHQSLDTGSRIVLNAADDRPNTVAPMSAAAPEYAPTPTTKSWRRRSVGRSNRGSPRTTSGGSRSSMSIESSSRSSHNRRAFAPNFPPSMLPRDRSFWRAITLSGPRFRARFRAAVGQRRPSSETAGHDYRAAQVSHKYCLSSASGGKVCVSPLFGS
jgi:phytoene dehydrogenase-like protein